MNTTEEAPEVVDLLGSVFEMNAKFDQYQLTILYEEEKHQRERWQARAIAAENQLEQALTNVQRLFFGQDFDV